MMTAHTIAVLEGRPSPCGEVLVASQGRYRQCLQTDSAFRESKLEAAFADHNPLISHSAWFWLAQQGLPNDLAAVDEAILGRADGTRRSLETVICAAQVTPIDEYRFEIDPDRGRWAAIQPVCHPEDGELIDLIAWNPRKPHRWRFLIGAGELLGAINIEIDPAIIRIFAHPAAWLKSGGEGVCVLRPERLLVIRHLAFAQKLIVDEPKLAAWLDRILRDPGPVPRVVVDHPRRAAT